MANNTLLRAKFEQLFSILTFYSRSKNILFITFRFLVTAEEQNKLYQQGRTKPGKIITNCDGYKKVSAHQRGRAKDIVIIDSTGKLIWDHVPEYDILGELWEQTGGKWGGRWFKEGKTKFDDCYHFEA